MTDENENENEDGCRGVDCGFDISIDDVTQQQPSLVESTTTTTTTTTTEVPRLYTQTTPPPPMIEQQQFLGASISSFSCNGGFGDSVSQLTATLVVDPTHGDSWNPNSVKVGEPVYFAFGNKQKYPRGGDPDTEQSFFSAIDDLYRVNKPQYGGPESGYNHSHFAFGGLFQSWDYNKDPNTGKIYNVNVVDPREILAGVQLLLNNYAGSTRQNTNMLNIYGYLEHENEDYKPLWTKYAYINPVYTSGGRSSYTYPQKDFPNLERNAPRLPDNLPNLPHNAYIQGRPITGEGMALRSENGIPTFRVLQAMNALMGFHQHPVIIGDQYSQYGGYIKFRGHYYLVDLTDLPIPDPYYLLSYDKMNLLELCMELCEASNHELAVSLLPLVDRDGTVLSLFYDNFVPQYYRDDGSVTRESDGNPGVKISGVIKITSIDRNYSSGQVSNAYIESLPFPTSSRDIGQELANEVTDKFVTGGKEVNMYYFDSSYDNFPFTRHGDHRLEKTIEKQVVPYYGKLANDTVTLPRGTGPWSQIILDAAACKAIGVGKYYVCTELELRAVDISFDKWAEFLQNYNILFKEKTFAGDIIDGPNNDKEQQGEEMEVQVTVPQCVWPPHPDDLARWIQNPGECSPPYGYPLYYGRATAIGLSAGGATGLNANNPRKGDKPKGPQKPPLEKNEGANASRDAAKSFDVAAAGFYARDGYENAQVIYNFLKGVVDEYLGKKFLVKIPQIPNKGYGFGMAYGFPPRDQYGEVESQYYLNGGVNQWDINRKKAMLKKPLAQTWRENGALQIGYNFNSTEFEFSYNPEPAGGRDGALPYTGGLASEVPLTPPFLRTFFNDSGRIPAYVMYPPAFKELNISSLDPNSYVLYDTTDEEFHAYTTPPPGVQDGDPVEPKTLFMKAELDSEYVYGPVTTRKTVDVYGQGTPEEEVIIEDNNDFIRISDGETVTTEFITPKIYIPTKEADGGQINLFTIDLIKSSDGIGNDYYNEAQGVGGVDVYCVITLPRVAYTEDGNYREGIANKVNLANLTHYLREDVVMGMPGLQNEIPDLPDEWEIEDFEQGANKEAILKAVEGLTFSINRRINMASPGPVIPLRVALPLSSNRRTYGPWQSGEFDNGKVEYIQDDSLTPWNFVDYNGMNQMGNLLASNTVASDLDNERAAFTIVGWPSGLTISSLLNNGPAITNMSLDFSTAGVTTTVTMDSYTPSFGKMQKQKADQLRKVSRLTQEMADQRNKLIRNNIINTKSNFSFSKAQKELKEYTDEQKRQLDYGRNSTTPLQRGEVENSNIMTFDHQPTKAIIDNQMYDPDAPPEGDFSGSGLAVTNSAMQSAKQLSETTAMVAQSRFQYHKQYFNSIASSTEELFIPASYTWHYLLPNVKQQVDRILYIDDIDNDEDVSYYD